VAKTQTERNRFISIHGQILQCAMTAFRGENPDKDRYWGPYEDEKVLIKTLVLLLLQLEDNQDARQLWQPIMELAPRSHLWGSWFFTQLFTETIDRPERHSRLKRIWGELLDFAFTSPAWAPKGSWEWRDSPELWRSLLRIESNFWSVNDEPTVELLKFVRPYLERWAEHSLKNRNDAVAFMGMLKSEAAGFLRCEGLIWLSRAMPVDEEWEWEDEGIQNTLAGLLVVLADKHSVEMSSREDVRNAFLAFATRLAAQQHGVAVELLQRISY
jgi:hypothetical protein